jgi:hypothetical protein
MGMPVLLGQVESQISRKCRKLKAYYFANKSTRSRQNNQTKPGKVNKQSTKTRLAGRVNLLTLNASIFAGATIRTNIHNKTGSVHHSVWLNEMSMN